MAEVLTMTDRTQPAHLPQTMPQMVGHGITTVVGGLTPAMLGVLLLNLVGIGAAVYFLNLLISGQQQHLENLLQVQTAQMDKVLSVTQAQMTAVLRTHDREFDMLMAMLTEATKPPPEPEEFLPPPRPP
jgi:hypothetical protein